jgi:DNA-binding response OmpR family regulator
VATRIMVVDDDLDTVNLLRLVLQRANYKVITASSMDEVIDRVKMTEQYHETIDLVILDIMMPIRSGFDVFLTLQVILHPMPPVIFLSAKTKVDDMIRASDLGAAKYLVKPTTPEKLLEAVRSVLNQVRE